jgi:VWFA-related protein
MMLIVVGVAAGGWAQSEDEQAERPVGGLEFVDEVQVTVVSVDVFVRDKKGRPVTDLTVDDFVVLQDGIEMPITHFAALDREVVEHRFATIEASESYLEMPEQQPEEPAEFQIRPLYMVLYVDNENIDPLGRNRVLRRVREFVSENMVGPVQMMVASYDRGLKLIQPFTDDPQEINQALRSMDEVSSGKTSRDNERRELTQALQEASVEDRGVARGDGVDGTQMRLRQRISAFAEQEAMEVNFATQSLREALAVLSGLEGRKSLVYISSGLPMSPGVGLMHQYAAIFDDPSYVGQRANTDRSSIFKSLVSAANSQEVSFYTIDASGLNPLEGFSADSRYSSDPTASSIGSKTYQDSLTFMAAQTGGLAIINTNDVSAGLELISDDVFTYYSLGYTISATGQDRVHRIEVKIPERSGHNLRYRRRFVEKSRETQVQDRVYSSLVVDVDDNLMDLATTRRRPIPASQDRWQVPIHLSFQLDTIALIPEGGEYVGRIVLFIGARDMKGRSSEMQRQEHEIRVPPEQYDEAKSKRFGIEVSLLLQEGQHRVSVGLMDQMTRQASYDRIVVKVPQ